MIVNVVKVHVKEGYADEFIEASTRDRNMW